MIGEENLKVGDKNEHTTELIITKSIMATMGCVPAYDQFFKKLFFNLNFQRSFYSFVAYN